MHGIVMVEFESFVQKNFGEPAWTQLCEEAQLGGRIYLPVAVYPDENIMALLDSAVQMTGSLPRNFLDSLASIWFRH